MAQKYLPEDSGSQDLTCRRYKIVLLKLLPTILGYDDGSDNYLPGSSTLLFEHTGSHLIQDNIIV